MRGDLAMKDGAESNDACKKALTEGYLRVVFLYKRDLFVVVEWHSTRSRDIPTHGGIASEGRGRGWSLHQIPNQKAHFYNQVNDWSNNEMTKKGEESNSFARLRKQSRGFGKFVAHFVAHFVARIFT